MRFEVYRDERKEWRWRLIAVNGKKVAVSGEGYHNYGDMMDTIMLIRAGVGMAYLDSRGRK